MRRRFRSRRLRFLCRLSLKRKVDRTYGHLSSLPTLRGLPADEKRRRLIESLHVNLAAPGDDDVEDELWTMADISPDGRTACAGKSMNYNYRSCELRLSAETCAQLIRSCRVRFSQGGSSWMPCGATPECLPETIASAVFAHHTKGATFDTTRSGAEWWAQVRQDGNPRKAIKFHWDADEFAVDQYGVNIHPHFSTVTYLTDTGAPTLIVDRRNPLKVGGTMTPCGSITQGMLSYPSCGKHIVFDGQLLHGTVPGMGEEGERVTFLVNVWLNHRPSNCHRLPTSIGQYLGSPDVSVSRTLTQLVAPKEEIVDPSGFMLRSKFAWRANYLNLRTPLPSTCSSAIIKWTHGADLRDA